MAGGGGLALLASLWTPWFTGRLSSGFGLLSLRRVESGWDVLGGTAGAVVALVAVLGLAWAIRPAGPLSGSWMVAAASLALVITVEATSSRLGADSSVPITYLPAWGLLVAYAGGATVLLAGVAALVAYARERSKSA